MWDHHTHPAPDRVYALIEAGKPAPAAAAVTPGCRVGQYLSLEGIRCLTAFCSEDGICSIQIDGDPSKRIGVLDEQATPLTFYFSPGEYIESIHVLGLGTEDTSLQLGPFLLVRDFSVFNSARALF